MREEIIDSKREFWEVNINSFICGDAEQVLKQFPDNDLSQERINKEASYG